MTEGQGKAAEITQIGEVLLTEEKDVKKILIKYHKDHEEKEWPVCYGCGKELSDPKGVVASISKAGTVLLCPKCWKKEMTNKRV